MTGFLVICFALHVSAPRAMPNGDFRLFLPVLNEVIQQSKAKSLLYMLAIHNINQMETIAFLRMFRSYMRNGSKSSPGSFFLPAYMYNCMT